MELGLHFLSIGLVLLGMQGKVEGERSNIMVKCVKLRVGLLESSLEKVVIPSSSNGINWNTWTSTGIILCAGYCRSTTEDKKGYRCFFLGIGTFRKLRFGNGRSL